MTYTVQAAQANLAQLLAEAEEGKDVLIERDGEVAIRLVAVNMVDTPAERDVSLADGEMGERGLSLEEFNAGLDALARYSEKIPALPIQTFSRASLYQDHD